MAENDNLRKTSTVEEWREHAEKLDELANAKQELMKSLSGSVPQSVYWEYYKTISDAQMKLRSELEERWAKEYPDSWTMELFYGHQITHECPKCNAETGPETLRKLGMCLKCFSEKEFE